MAEATGRFWWSQVTGPATLVRECVRVLVARGSCLLSLPAQVPFEEPELLLLFLVQAS